jgi:hypothetical protein
VTFDEIVDAVCDDLNISANASRARIGRKVNKHYRAVTSSIGVKVARPAIGITGTATLGIQTLTFTGIERIDRVIYDGDGSVTVLTPMTLEEVREANPGTDRPTGYAVEWMGPGQVRVRFDSLPQSAYTFKADGLETASELSGDQEPQFSSDFHDILVDKTLADERRKDEKATAERLDRQAEKRLSELRLFNAIGQVIRPPGSTPSTTFGQSTGGSGGGAPSGGTSYEQTGLVTFDRGAGAPFAVVLGAAVVANLDADKLDGQHGSYYLNRANHTGSIDATALTGFVPLASISGLTNTQIDAAAAIAWSKISKTGSSLADLTTRSAADLTTGTLPDARFPATLPAASGVNLTALNASNLASGTVAEARLGSGTGSVNKVLRGNNTWGDAPGITTDGASAIQQLVFAATQSASANANTLDDYEEGTWTPVIGGAGGTTGQTYGTQTGTYLKVGKLVICQFQATLTAKGTITGALIISGLPFTVGGSLAFGFTALMWDSTVSSFATVLALPNPTTTHAILRGTTSVSTSSNGTPVTTDIGNTTTFAGTIIFLANA